MENAATLSLKTDESLLFRLLEPRRQVATTNLARSPAEQRPHSRQMCTAPAEEERHHEAAKQATGGG